MHHRRGQIGVSNLRPCSHGLRLKDPAAADLVQQGVASLHLCASLAIVSLPKYMLVVGLTSACCAFAPAVSNSGIKFLFCAGGLRDRGVPHQPCSPALCRYLSLHSHRRPSAPCAT